MSRPRQPADLDVQLYFDFEPVMPLRGYSYLEANGRWMAGGDWNANVLRETRAGRQLADVALAAPSALDKARWQVVVRPRGEQRILSSLIVRDLDADYGWFEGAARDSVACYGDTYTSMFAGVILTPNATVAASTTGLSTWAADLDVRTGPAETVALGLIADHFGPAAPVAAARFPRLNIPASLGRGATVTSGRRFPNLLDELRAICTDGGITVRLEQSQQDGKVDVVVTEQQLRPEVTLSRDRNTLLGWRVRGSAAVAGSALVGGRGEGAARVFTQVNAATPAGGWAYPRRVLVNATSEDELEPMRQSGRTELAELNQPLIVSVRPSPAAPWVPGLDFDLGDRLLVTEGDAAVEAFVDEVTVRHGAGSAPTVTSGSSTPGGARLAAAINRLTRALRRATP